MKIVEKVLEEMIFRSRWVLAPAYIVLIGCLVILSFDTVTEFVQFVSILGGHGVGDYSGGIFNETKIILQTLTIVDLVLVLNLVLMVIFVGYVNFVSKIQERSADDPNKTHEDWPEWVGKLDYSGLKLKLLGSIIAIASIKLLREFVTVADYGEVVAGKLTWMVGLYVTFLFGVLVTAAVNRLEIHDEKK